MSQPQQQSQQPQKRELTEFHVFVCLEGEHEAAIARAYMQKTYPGSKARLVQELRLDRLHDKHTVIALWRDRGCTPPVMAPRDDVSGGRGLELRDPDTLVSEVLEGKPIHVRDHWGEGDLSADDDMGMTSMSDGELQKGTFLNAIGTSMSKCHVTGKRAREPAIVKRSTDARTLKLGRA